MPDRRFSLLAHGHTNLLNKTAAETITGALTIDVDQGALTLTGNSPELILLEDDAALNEGSWLMQATGNAFRLGTTTDADHNTIIESALKITRTGTTINLVQIRSDLVRVLEDLQVDETLSVTGVATFADDIRIAAGSDKGVGITGITNSRFSLTRITLADDATGTVELGTNQAFIVIVTSFNRGAAFAAFTTSQQAWDNIAAQGSTVELGTSTNPDVDAKVNYWKSSSSVLSIKNRLGSTRNFLVYSLNV